MNKALKNLLSGIGVAAVGLLVYSLWKEAEKPAVAQHPDSGTVPTSPTKEYVERRKQQIRKAAETRRAAQQKAVVPPFGEEMPQEGASLEAGEKPEKGSAALGEQDAAPVESAPPEEPAPPEQAEEHQEET